MQPNELPAASKLRRPPLPEALTMAYSALCIPVRLNVWALVITACCDVDSGRAPNAPEPLVMFGVGRTCPGNAADQSTAILFASGDSLVMHSATISTPGASCNPLAAEIRAP